MSPEGAEGETGALGDNPVAGNPELSGAREVHPGLQPISHSTNFGLSDRRCEVGADGEDSLPCVTVSGAGREGRKRLAWWVSICCIFPSTVPAASSLAEGVIHIRFRACWSSPISSLRSPPRLRKLSAAGVCQMAASLTRSRCLPSFAVRPAPGAPCELWACGVLHSPVAPVRLSVAFGWFPALPLSADRGVGQDEEPFALVGGANFRRREEAARNDVTQFV